ncbi:MAG: hypothetical protein JNK43_00030 [Ignavibacteria bacterium]|nr:hypothetical protein [Ignavibacteria bacterium]
MKKGFFYIRNSEHPILFNYVVWVEGEKDDITSFMGTNASAPQYPVTPYKCTDCGYIEHYADPSEKWRH